jgi:hypothetical protein
MGDMDKEGQTRTIRIPVWMDAVISELALKHNQKVECEIESLVAAALDHEAKTGEAPHLLTND